jgi:hypothetical protein
MIFICWLPWCASFINQAQRVSSDFWLTFSPVHSPQQTISGLINGIRLFTQEPFSLAFSLYTFVALGLLIYGTKKDLKQFPGSFPLCYFFWLPLIFMFLVSFLRPILYMRYASFLFPFMIMLIYQGLSHLPTKFYKVAVFSILLCAQLNIYIFYVTTTDSKPHYSELVDYLEHNVNGNEAIIHINSLSFFPVHYYAQIFYDETPLEAPISIYDPNHLTPHYTGTALLEENDFTRDLTVLAKFDRLWLIEEGATTGRLDFIDSYSLLATYQFEGNLHLELWQKNEKTCNCDAHI